MAEERHHAQCHVGLPHPDFVCEIGDAVLPQDVVERDRPFELLVGSSALSHPAAEVQEARGDFGVDHASSSATDFARLRNHRSNQSRNPAMSPVCPASIRARIAEVCSRS